MTCYDNGRHAFDPRRPSVTSHDPPGVSGRFHLLRFAPADQLRTVFTSASVIFLEGLSSLRLNQLITAGA